MQAKSIIYSFENWGVGLLEAKTTTSTDFFKQIQTQAQCQQRGCINFQVLLLSQTIQMTLLKLARGESWWFATFHNLYNANHKFSHKKPVSDLKYL